MSRYLNQVKHDLLNVERRPSVLHWSSPSRGLTLSRRLIRVGCVPPISRDENPVGVFARDPDSGPGASHACDCAVGLAVGEMWDWEMEPVQQLRRSEQVVSVSLQSRWLPRGWSEPLIGRSASELLPTLWRRRWTSTSP